MLKIHCLGILQTHTGSPLVEIEWPADNKIETALTTLQKSWPSISGELARCACAIGDALVKREHTLQAGDELVLLPPVGGG